MNFRGRPNEEPVKPNTDVLEESMNKCTRKNLK